VVRKIEFLIKKIFSFDYLDEEDMRYSQSRSRRYILDFKFRRIMKFLFSPSRRQESPTVNDSDHDRHSSSRSKSRKKSSKTTQSPKRRSRFALIFNQRSKFPCFSFIRSKKRSRSRSSRDRKRRSRSRSYDRHRRKKDSRKRSPSRSRSRSKGRHHRSDSRKDKKSRR
jgi:hypothetical protein